MARRIVKDITRTDKPKNHMPLHTEKTPRTPTSAHVAAPHNGDIDLRNITVGSARAGQSSQHLTDINTTAHDETIIVAQKPAASRLIGFGAIAVFGALIISLIYAGQAYTRGQKLFGDVVESAQQGYQGLFKGAMNVRENKIAEAHSIFEAAYQQFQSAQQSVKFFAEEPSLKDANAIMTMGSDLARAGTDLITAMNTMRALPDLIAHQMTTAQTERIDAGADTNTDITPLTLLASANGAARRAQTTIGGVISTIKNLDASSIPARFRAQLTTGTKALTIADKLLNEINDMLPGLIELFGNQKTHRTLILLQNNDEVRATGGFIGSVILLETENGYITTLKLQDVYDIDGQWRETAEPPIPPPPEIKPLTDRWFFRDSNTSPDFRVSGEKAAWFYEKETGLPVDTIIAVNHELLGKILELTGPITVPEIAANGANGATNATAQITADNYRAVLTYLIETKQTGAADPKLILKNLFPLVQQAIVRTNRTQEIMTMLLEEVVQKNIVGYSRNPLTQKLFTTLGADAALTEENADDDYLAVIASSVSGNKSDAYITQDITHDTIIERDGAAFDQVTIKRVHTWSGATELKWLEQLKPFGITNIPDHVFTTLGKGINKAIMKVYIPSGAQLISADGITIDKIQLIRDPATQRTYATFPMETAAGTATTIALRYKLPFHLNRAIANTYQLNVQKQPGARPSTITKRIALGEGVYLPVYYPNDAITDEQGITIWQTRLNKDLHFAALLTHQPSEQSGK